MIQSFLATFSRPFLSGVFAALASVFGKFASSDHPIYYFLSVSLGTWSSVLSLTVIVGLRLVFVALVILSNALQWRFQLHALSASDATFPVTIATLASNIVVASLAGFLLFGEVITSTWVS